MLVKSEATRVFLIRGTPIYPKLNRIASAIAEKVKKDAMFKEQCKLGTFTVVDENEVGEGDTLTDTILEMSIDDAVAAVKETLDIDELRSIKRRDKRLTIQRAAEAQIDKLTEDREKDK